MKARDVKDYIVDAGPMGPIGEGESLILRMTQNCPWNRCLFCPVYKDAKFSFRTTEEIKHDIDAVARIVDLVESTSQALGCSGSVTREVVSRVIRANPELYGDGVERIGPEQRLSLASLNSVLKWMLHGSRLVFLQDADTLVMRPRDLEDCLHYLKERLSTADTITSYARSQTCAKRTPEELAGLRAAGLTHLLVGIESGDNDVLRAMKKGVTSKQQVDGGRKVMEAGIHLATFIMPGLAGRDPARSQRHVRETLRVLNAIRPTEVRVRSLAVTHDSPLYGLCVSGGFVAPTDDQMIEEIRLIVEGLEFDCIFETLQMTNVLFNVRGRLPLDRQKLLGLIERYQGAPLEERLHYRLSRYVHGGYVGCVEGWGKLDQALVELITTAASSLERGLPDAEQAIDAAVFAIKSKGIP